MKTILDQINERQKQLGPEYGVLAPLAAGMQVYDDKLKEVHELDQERDGYIAELDKYDHTQYPDNVSANLGIHAVGIVALEKRIQDILVVADEVSEVTVQLSRAAFRAFGDSSDIRIISSDPNTYDLKTKSLKFLASEHPISLSRHEATAGISRYNLAPEESGWIELIGQSMVYMATPLIDRDRDYRPAFRIEKA